jgi:hypothetical protein
MGEIFVSSTYRDLADYREGVERVTPRIFPASEDPNAKYRYDIVVGRKKDLRHEHQ